MSVEIPFTDAWMDAPEPIYAGGKPLLNSEQLETLEQGRGVGTEERLRVLLAMEEFGVSREPVD